MSEVEIADAEAELGVRFPEDYRYFLSHWGWARIGPTEVLGLGPNNDRSNVVDSTVGMWGEREDLVSWNEKFVVINHVGNGNVNYLRTNSPYRGQVPVMHWDHELLEHTIVALSFTHWIDSILGSPHLISPGPLS